MLRPTLTLLAGLALGIGVFFAADQAMTDNVADHTERACQTDLAATGPFLDRVQTVFADAYGGC